MWIFSLLKAATPIMRIYQKRLKNSEIYFTFALWFLESANSCPSYKTNKRDLNLDLEENPSSPGSRYGPGQLSVNDLTCRFYCSIAYRCNWSEQKHVLDSETKASESHSESLKTIVRQPNVENTQVYEM
jgi:hypothetical protein